MIKKILSLIQKNNSGETDKSEHSILIAAVSLLIEVTKADHHLSEQEQTKLTELVSKHFKQDNLEQQELIKLAQTSSDKSTSLYEFTSIINEYYSEAQKLKLITLMWEVAYSDNSIDRYEEHLIRRVADLIYLPHANFIEAKHQAKRH